MGFALLAVAAVVSYQSRAGAPLATAPLRDKSADDSALRSIERGEYLVQIAGCNDCHTPWKMTEHGPAPDMSRMLSGHPQHIALRAPVADPASGWVWSGAMTNTAFAGPWGISYAANLTPDSLTGMAVWDEDRFIKAMRTGRHFGEARPIMPPMPWQNVGRMTDEDLRSVFAYLKSIPAVRNQVPDCQPPAQRSPARAGMH
jgi:mono/diheme cytochrome c family protein